MSATQTLRCRNQDSWLGMRQELLPVKRLPEPTQGAWPEPKETALPQVQELAHPG
jgi:hypothetical protein